MQALVPVTRASLEIGGVMFTRTATCWPPLHVYKQTQKKKKLEPSFLFLISF